MYGLLGGMVVRAFATLPVGDWLSVTRGMCETITLKDTRGIDVNHEFNSIRFNSDGWLVG